MDRTNITVSKRRVFHIPGYDPKHPRRYRELYRTESQAQAEISGYKIGISPTKTGDDFGWNVGAEIDGKHVLAKVKVLVWADIVRASMAQTIPATYMQLAHTAWTYITSGALRRLMWMRKGPVIAALYPVGMLLLQLFAGLFIGWYLGATVQSALFWLLNIVGLTDVMIVATIIGWIGWAAKWAIIIGITTLMLRWFKKQDHKLFAYYLMHDYAHSAKAAGAYPPELKTRMDDFGTTIAQALTTDADEVLIVGHSSGAHLAVSILADLVRTGRVPKQGPQLALMTLGQVIPMMSFLPEARQLRADLLLLSQSNMLTWVDVSAPGDGCCFALCDPVAVTGLAKEGKKWPLIVSAAFSKSLSSSRWQELRWRFFRLHFQYLCAFDKPRDYDYFQITAGPQTLAGRYRDRPPSKSRIDVAVSKYTTVLRE